MFDSFVTFVRCSTLEPISNPAEHNFTVPAAIERLRGDSFYVEAFENAYKLNGAPLDAAHLASALAAFERTLFSANSRFDRNELSSLEQQGRGLFYGRARCAGCHSGPNFTDERFHAIGFDTTDEQHHGREKITGRLSDRGKFRRLSLREIERTAPYFHNGSAETLMDVVDFYNDGGDPVHPNRDFAIQPLGLTDSDKTALIAFLKSLNGTTLPNSINSIGD